MRRVALESSKKEAEHGDASGMVVDRLLDRADASRESKTLRGFLA
jgi:hypothetical protein